MSGSPGLTLRYHGGKAPVGGASRPRRLAKLDGRTREARRLKEIRRDLIAHVGGNPSAPERYLIERAAMDLLRLELLDIEASTNSFSEHDGRVAHALRGSLRLSLRELGLKPTAASKPMTVSDYSRLLAARRGAA